MKKLNDAQVSEILQIPLSDNHNSGMFFDGVVATKGDYKLITVQDGEIAYDGKKYVGGEIRKMAIDSDINDEIMEAEETVTIFVDKFFTIVKGDEESNDDLIFSYFDEAIAELEKITNL